MTANNSHEIHFIKQRYEKNGNAALLRDKRITLYSTPAEVLGIARRKILENTLFPVLGGIQSEGTLHVSTEICGGREMKHI